MARLVFGMLHYGGFELLSDDDKAAQVAAMQHGQQQQGGAVGRRALCERTCLRVAEALLVWSTAGAAPPDVERSCITTEGFSSDEDDDVVAAVYAVLDACKAEASRSRT